MNIYQRINAVMKETDYLQKKGAAQGKGVKYDEVIAMLRDLLIKHGVVMVVRQTSLEAVKENGKQVVYQGSYEMDLINMDEPKEVVTHSAFGQGMDGGDKAAGKAHTYAVKIMLVKAFGIETGDDEESRSEKLDKLNTITEHQEATLRPFCVDDSGNLTLLGGRVRRAYKINRLSELPASKYDEVLKMLEGVK